MSKALYTSINGAARKCRKMYTVQDGVVRVTVGSVAHPMQQEHHIAWISLQTRQGNQRKEIFPGEAPEACFALCDGDEVEAVFAYCNLHGLWMA